MQAKQAFEEVPPLLYIYHTWSAEERLAWKQLTPYQQVCAVDSRQRDLPDDCAVVPFFVQTESTEDQPPLLDTTNLAPVIVLLQPQVYVGLAASMRSKLKNEPDEVPSGTWERTGGPGKATKQDKRWPSAIRITARGTSADDWNLLDEFKLPNATMRGILEKLEEFYHNNMGGCLWYFRQLRHLYIGAGRAAAAAGQPYGTDGVGGQPNPWKMDRPETGSAG